MAEEVGLELLADFGQAQVFDESGHGEAGVVHQDVDAAVVAHHALDQRGDGIGLSNVQAADVKLRGNSGPFGGFVEDLRLAEIRQQFETNFFAHVAMTKAVLPIMRRQCSGHIIMVSSISGRVGQPVLSSYSSSKFALEGWSEALRIETLSLGIRVVLVEPGAFGTDIWQRNAKLGEDAFSADSPNRERGERFAEMVKKLHKADAIVVARLIARIAADPNPKLRYRIGFDAHLQRWLRALLPWRAYERLVAKAVKIN